jgi:hypothetical protein
MLGGDDNLRIYLQDHYAGSTFGLELARRIRRENRGTRFDGFLTTLVEEIAEDRATLSAIMNRLDVGVDQLKVSAAWAIEKGGRLKLNGQLTGYSPLSRVLEFEGLLGGVEGKLGLWRTLRMRAATDSRLDAEALDRLIGRAERQIEGLREHQGLAAEAAFAPGA